LGVKIGLPVVIFVTVAPFLFFQKRSLLQRVEVEEDQGYGEDVKEPITVVQELETPTTELKAPMSRTELQAGLHSVELSG
jgi:hypothetical protein